MAESADVVQSIERVRVFVDYWNLQLGARERLKRNFQPDWRRIPQWLGTDAVRLAIGDPSLPLRLGGLTCYMSYNPASEADRKFKTWASNFLDRVPSVQVVCKEFLSSKGRRVIHVGFPPKGMNLAKTCWASLDLGPHLRSLERV